MTCVVNFRFSLLSRSPYIGFWNVWSKLIASRRGPTGTLVSTIFATRAETDLENLRAAALQIDPANAATLDLLDRAANLYPLVANGEQSGDRNLLGRKACRCG